MQKNIHLPQIELTMESVQVVAWLVQVGDRVVPDQPILEIESQKGTVEVPTAEAGYVRKLCVNNGDTIAEKALLCVLTDSSDEPLSELIDASAVKAVPAARKLARDLGVDLATIKGSGPDGRILVEDVEKRRASNTSHDDKDPGWQTLSPTRLALIAQMKSSLAEIPQFHVARRIGVQPFSIKVEGITFTHRLVVAVAAALVKHPALSTTLVGDRTKVQPVSVAVAMDTPRGLVAPAVRSADKLSLQQVAATIRELRTRAENGTLKREELIDAPFAVSNLGMLDIDFFSPFVFSGQTAVLAVGKVLEHHAWFNLAVDHRVVDGAEAARFLQTLSQVISAADG